MKFTLLVAVFLFVAIAHSVYGAPEPANTKYTTKYDNINLDEILNSSRLLDNYCKCLLDLGRCTPEGKELKSEYNSFLYFWIIPSVVIVRPFQEDIVTFSMVRYSLSFILTKDTMDSQEIKRCSAISDVRLDLFEIQLD